jgi:AP-3 complex subunit mu
VKGQLQLPIYVKPQIGGGRVSVMVGLKNTGGKVVEEMSLTLQFPKSINTATLTANYGTVQYDDQNKVAKWLIGKIPKDKSPLLEGSTNPATTSGKIPYTLLILKKLPLLSRPISR